MKIIHIVVTLNENMLQKIIRRMPLFSLYDCIFTTTNFIHKNFIRNNMHSLKTIKWHQVFQHFVFLISATFKAKYFLKSLLPG